MSEQTSEILSRLAGTYLAVEELNTAVPAIQKGFRDTGQIINEIRELSESAEKTLKDAESQSETFNKDAKKAINQIAGAVKRAEKIQEELDKKIEAFPDTEEILDELDELSEQVGSLKLHVDYIEHHYGQKIEELENQLRKLLEEGVFTVDPGSDQKSIRKETERQRGKKPKGADKKPASGQLSESENNKLQLYTIELRKKIEELESQSQKLLEEDIFTVDLASDQKSMRKKRERQRGKKPKGADKKPASGQLSESEGNEHYSIEQLAKLVDQDKLLVVREKWRGDFCFLVTSINRGYASGTQYLNGNEYKQTRFRSDAEEFRLYDGPSKSRILNKE